MKRISHHLNAQSLCDGCIFAHKEASKEYNCPFCRYPVSNTDEQHIKLTMKRSEVNDIDALYMLGCHYFQGSMGLKKDLQKANEYYNKAADLGSNAGHHTLGDLV